MSIKSRKILVTATGGAVASTILQMIKEVTVVEFEIIATDMSIDTSFLPTVSAFEQVPAASDASYVSVLREIIAKHSPDYLLPLTEEECRVASQLAVTGQLDCQYLGMSFETIELLTDKIDCMDFLTAKGIQVPQYYALDSFDDFEKKLKILGYPEKKIVFKPRTGRGSRGFRVIDESFGKFAAFNQKGPQTYVTLDMLKYSFEDDPQQLSNYLVMEFLTGSLGGCDMVAYDGQVLAAFPAFPKDGMWGAYTHVDLKVAPEFEDYCRSCAEAVGMHGLCNVEAGYNDSGDVRLIEMNSRTSATAHQNHLVGPNNMDLFMRAHLDEPIEEFVQEKEATYRLLLEMYEV